MSLRAIHSITATAAALGLLAAAGMCMAQTTPDPEKLQQAIFDLEQRNRALQSSLTEANRGEKQAAEQLDRVRERLEALGKNLLDGGDDRLVQAAADLQLANERIAELESATTRLTATVNEYLRQAVVSDPDARLQVETSLRELDAVLGLRQKPRPDVRTGSLQQARIVSLDQESGMLVVNIGESQGARIGMTFRLVRGQQPYGKAILADVRNSVSGLFVESLDNPAANPQSGDLAILEIQASPQ
jgi:flagellar basal body-associated protein FliL